MEIRHLRYFVAVAEEMNVRQAAKNLNISQPPLSLTIQQLEDEIGTQLFTRVGRGIEITRAGINFLRDAKDVIHRADQAKYDALQIGSGVKGTIKIGFISSAVIKVLPKIVENFKSLLPDVNIELNQAVSGNLCDDVTSGQYDFGIVRNPEYLAANIDSTTLLSESWYVVYPRDHYLSQKKSLTIEDLEDQKLIFYPRSNNPGGYDDMMSLFSEKGIVPDFTQYAEEQMTILGLVSCGIGVGIVPECMKDVSLYALEFKKIKGTSNRTGFSLIYNKNPDSLLCSALEIIESTRRVD